MKSVCALALMGLAGSATGQFIDGQIVETDYQLIWSNNEGTTFGNNRSEINGIWAYCDATTLYLGVSGNVQDFNQLNDKLGGLTFDAGFEANYYLTYTVNGDRNEHYTSAAQLDAAGGGPGGFQGGGGYVDGDQIAVGGANGFGYTLGTNQSNVGGVADFGNPNDSDPALVSTGVEIAISLDEIGYDGSGMLRLAGFINGGSHDYVSNQIIGGAPAGTGSLGNDMMGNFIDGSLAGIDFNNLAGDQFVTLKVPAPGSLALLGLGGLAAARRRR